MAVLILGAIILPVALEVEVHRRTGGSPIKDYRAPPTRGTALAYVAGAVVLAAVSLVALKVTGQSWVVLPGALVLAVGTVAAMRWIDQQRAGTHGSHDPQA